MNTPATFRRPSPDDLVSPANSLNNLDSPLLFRALNLANEAHFGQRRKVSGAPYLIHPLNVANILLEYGFPADPFGVAALLHDTVEDTYVTVALIRESFGEEIASMVERVSHPDKDMSWWDRRVHAVDGLRQAPENVLVLACADKLDNLSSIRRDLSRLGDSVWDKFRAPRDMQAWYYRSLAEVFLNRRGNGGAAARLFDAFGDEVTRMFGRGTPACAGLY